MKRWSGVRLASGAAVGAWAILFWFLWLTGRTGLYLSARTAWLVPTGAIVLTVAAIGRLATSRSATVVRISRREAWMLGLVVLPVVLMLSLPRATLGTFAVGRRASAGGVAGVVTPGDFEHGPLTMVHVASAQTNDEDLARLRARAGETVELTGLVVGDADSPGGFLLTNFIVTCCVADAVSAAVRVVDVPPGSVSEGGWARVVGRIYPLGREIVVVASTAEDIPTPEEPYVTAA